MGHQMGRAMAIRGAQRRPTSQKWWDGPRVRGQAHQDPRVRQGHLQPHTSSVLTSGHDWSSMVRTLTNPGLVAQRCESRKTVKGEQHASSKHRTLPQNGQENVTVSMMGTRDGPRCRAKEEVD